MTPWSHLASHELRTNLPLPTCSMEKYRSDLFEKKRYIKKTTHLRRKKGPLHSTCACSIDLPNDHAPRWYAARPPAKALHLSRFSTYRARAPKRCQFCTFKVIWGDDSFIPPERLIIFKKLKVPFWGITF